MQKKITVTLLRSLSGRKKNHIACANGLGLRRIRQTVEVIDTPENRGMINQIPYLVQVSEQVI
jgi:large subunit ribosomal protein L30